MSLSQYKRKVWLGGGTNLQQSLMKQLILLIFLVISSPGSAWPGEMRELPHIQHLLQSVITGNTQPQRYERVGPEVETGGYNTEILRTSHRVRKRSPRCIRSCLKQQILHPAQCHSYCRAGF